MTPYAYVTSYVYVTPYIYVTPYAYLTHYIYVTPYIYVTSYANTKFRNSRIKTTFDSQKAIGFHISTHIPFKLRPETSPVLLAHAD